MKSKKFKLSAIVFYSVIIALALVLPNMAFATPVPDTGQWQSYTDTFGEDADYTCSPHSYTDLGNGIVRDNVTGLEWQQATAPGVYTWDDANTYCASLTLGGHSDWRLPTVKELSYLLDSSIPEPGPTINFTIYFPDTVPSSYWSSTTKVNHIIYAWSVGFESGYVLNLANKSGSIYVRAVRGGLSSNVFVDNGNGTITDTSTGLMWQKDTAPGISYGHYTWEQALTYCENLTLAGYSDWRLPNRNELQSIVDYRRYNPAINTTFFPDTAAAGFYLSATTVAGYPYYAWVIGMGYGDFNGYLSKTYNGSYVRAVRGGQCGSLGDLVISKSGNGTGTVTSADGAIDCGNDCSESYDISTQVTLHAAADAGSIFTGWSGGECSGTGDCTVSFDGSPSETALSVTAEFQVQPSKLSVDTGQTQSYTDTFGEDPDYTCNPHSYTDLGNGIVRDNATGLEWQQATAPGTYTWTKAIAYCNNLSLGGKDDWRLPTIKELLTLVDSSRFSPAINTSFFTDTVASYYCSYPTIRSGDSRWYVVNFGYGIVRPSEYGSIYVRAVRGGQSNNSFVDNYDGTITDTGTGLMWQKATAPGTYTWEQALTYCENLTLAGYSDWRLPNRNELQSIVDYRRYNPAINTTFFPDTPVVNINQLPPSGWPYYWSSTTYANNTIYAWGVFFVDGSTGGYIKSNTTITPYATYVRAVRGGQCAVTTTTTAPVTTTTTAPPPSTTTTTPPTVIELSSFTATPYTRQVILKWSTESETDNAGFNLYRSTTEDGDYTKINTSLIPAQGSPTQGASYEFVDKDVKNRKTYYYKLEDIDLNGTSTMHGPVSATPRWFLGIFGIFGK